MSRSAFPFDVSERHFRDGYWRGGLWISNTSTSPSADTEPRGTAARSNNEAAALAPAAEVPHANFLSVPKASPRAERKFEGSPALPFASFEEALANVPAEPEWLWVGYLAPGVVTLLAGKPKVGKSTLASALLKALAAGEPFLDRAVKQSRALVLSEERASTLREKLDRWSLDDHALLMRHQAEESSWPDAIAQAVHYCHQKGIRLLVVDTFDKWAPLSGDAENSSGAVIEVLQPLLLAAASGLAVLIITHQRKAEGRYGEGVRGSNALTGAVDIIIELERRSSIPAHARLLVAVSRFDSTPDELTLALDEDGYQALGSTADAIASGERDRILAALHECGSATREELAEVTGIPAGTIRKRIAGVAAVEVSGRGVKGDPHRFSFRTPESPSAETNPGAGEAT